MAPVKRPKKGAQPSWPEGYVPQYKINHYLFQVQAYAEIARVGWRHEIERQLGIRYSYWRDVSYRIFPPDWMVELGYHRPLLAMADQPPPREQREGQMSLWDQREAA